MTFSREFFYAFNLGKSIRSVLFVGLSFFSFLPFRIVCIFCEPVSSYSFYPYLMFDCTFSVETSKWIKLDIFGPTEMIFPFHSVCSYMSNVSNNCQQPSADSLSPNTTNANASFCFFGGLDGGVAHTSFLILQTTNVELNSESENSENDSPYIPGSKIDQDDDFVSSPRDLDKCSYSDAESEYCKCIIYL